MMQTLAPESHQRLSLSSSVFSFSDIKGYEDLEIVKRLSETTFPVFLTHSLKHGSHFIMKVFPYEQEACHPGYLRESKLQFVNHPNIIRHLEVRGEKDVKKKGKIVHYSTIIQELAPFGDFWNLVMKDKMPKDEKLTRTFFHGLIDGLEYLHNHQIAHQDLKLENLLLGENFILKIGGLSSSIPIEKNALCVHEGSSDYRAPEVKAGVCRNPAKADIYSAGILLFLLKYRMFPYSEDVEVMGYDLYEILMQKPHRFFPTFQKVNEGILESTEDFRELFLSMTTSDSAKRATIHSIRESKWFQGPVYQMQKRRSILKHKAISHLSTIKSHKHDKCCNIF
jgi:serine/threonine protein kinase